MTNQEAKEILIDEKNNLKENPNVIVEQCLYDTLDTSIRALLALDKVIIYCKQSSSAILPEDILSLIRGENVEIETDYEYKKFEPCSDAISRQAVLNQTYLWSKDEFLRITNPFDYLRKRINDLPPVNPQEPKTVLYSGDGYADGYMVYDMAECPNCGYKYEDGDKDWGLPFCPNCGQKLNWEGEAE